MSDLSKWIKKNLVTRYVLTTCPERRKCYETLQMVLDGEIGDESMEEYKDHIDQCWCCFQDYKLEKAIRDLIKFKIQKKPVPETLLTTIKDRLSENPE